MGECCNIVGELTGVSKLEGSLSAQNGMSGVLSVPESSYQPYELPPATTDTLGGIIVGNDLQITEQGILSVITAQSVEDDNTHPITAAAVYTEIGNINALLNTI